MAIGSPGSRTYGLTRSWPGRRRVFEIVEREADGAATIDVTPDRVAQADDEPSLALRDEPVLRLLQLRLGDSHGRT